ncbi:hypothetical protein BC749_1011000 [Flavobacterium araucananum]|nr:hypothetical protein BC749_1011000 [Flavobacterium araucananum]
MFDTFSNSLLGYKTIVYCIRNKNTIFQTSINQLGLKLQARKYSVGIKYW